MRHCSKGFTSIGPLLLTQCYELGSIIFILIEVEETEAQIEVSSPKVTQLVNGI